MSAAIDPGVAARHSSATNEHYTPAAIVEAARYTLGALDLDPASCALANRGLVKASTFYDAEANGFGRVWMGRVFLNPPGGRCDERGVTVERGGKSAIKAWWLRLVEEYDAGRTTAAIFVAFSLEFLQSCQVGTEGKRTPFDFPICVPSRRLAYMHDRGDGVLEPGASPPHGSFIVCLPPSPTRPPSPGSGSRFVRDRFREAFSPIGRVP